MNTLPDRKLIRYKGVDYTQEGIYFITICCQGNKCLFGKVLNDNMQLNEVGEMVFREWELLEQRFQNMQLLEFIIMPNHIHGIVQILDQKKVSIPDVVRTFKSKSTVNYIKGMKERGWPRFEKRIWQRNYYEHIIRSSESYMEIAHYIVTNPVRWSEDKFYQ